MKRLLLLFCCFVLMIVVFASCVSQTPPQNEPDESTAGVTDGAGDGTTAESETEDPCLTAHDYQNRVCTRCGDKQPSEGLKFQFNEFHQGYLLEGLGTCTDTEIIIPSVYQNYPVIGITSSAFQNGKSLTKIEIPDSVFFVFGDAFDDCKQVLQTENGISYLGQWAISCQDKTLTTYELRPDTRGLATSLFNSCVNLTSITLPDGLIAISGAAFMYCTSLTEIEIPSTVRYIGGNAFENCKNVSNLTIPNGVTYIADRAFSHCKKIKSLVLPEGVTLIKRQAFSYCMDLKTVFIPKSVTKIEARVAEYCIDLEYVFYAGTKEDWSSVDIDLTEYSSGNNMTNANAALMSSLYYYSETAPTSKGYYWHYVDGVPTPW